MMGVEVSDRKRIIGDWREKGRKYYKGKYFIAFYDYYSDQLYQTFNNVKEIVEYKGREMNKQNINEMNVLLGRVLMQKEPTMFLDGKKCRVFIFDVEEEED